MTHVVTARLVRLHKIFGSVRIRSISIRSARIGPAPPFISLHAADVEPIPVRIVEMKAHHAPCHKPADFRCIHADAF